MRLRTKLKIDSFDSLCENISVDLISQEHLKFLRCVVVPFVVGVANVVVYIGSKFGGDKRH